MRIVRVRYLPDIITHRFECIFCHSRLYVRVIDSENSLVFFYPFRFSLRITIRFYKKLFMWN